MASETIADIVADLRHNSKGIMFYFHTSENGLTHAMGADYVELADRIEAATKRETVGNEAAIRAALQTIHDRVNSLDEECGVDPIDIRDIARAALREPPRNCDRFDSYKQARQEWWKTEVLPRVYGVVIGAEKPFDEWLFDIATEGVAK